MTPRQARCPITYDEISGPARYSEAGLSKLSPRLENLRDFPFSAEEQRMEAEARSSKMSIQGVQPKLSAVLNVASSTFELTDSFGRYIMKPQVERFRNLPENEDLSMRLARLAGIEVPLHGLVYSKDGSMTYFIKRFDRYSQKQKYHVEDFAQLSGESRETKYKSSMEEVAKVIESFCTFPVIEKLKLFRLTLFSFLIGNEDMHLKNFSIIMRGEKVQLAPAYDLVNSTIAMTSPKEEMALPIRGKKSGLTKGVLVEYFGMERLGIERNVLTSVVNELRGSIPAFQKLIAISFLPDELRKKYSVLVDERAGVLF
ncbi:MAG: phosphatidylinositol kinase [Bdellovibrionales bacterium RIFOXYD1_FULL_53_11]|nr:MAG: phosphatidylinositol kinase [Bdellovibrionales bacterium RIFOXYD1_FULL_53_11]